MSNNNTNKMNSSQYFNLSILYPSFLRKQESKILHISLLKGKKI